MWQKLALYVVSNGNHSNQQQACFLVKGIRKLCIQTISNFLQIAGIHIFTSEESQVIASCAYLHYFFADIAVSSQYCHLLFSHYSWKKEMPKQPIYIFSH